MSTRLTLLCGANPRTAKCGPTVRLQAGRWRFYCDGVSESSLLLTVGSNKMNVPVAHESEFELTVAETVCIDFVKRGLEKYVSVNVECVA